MKFLKSYEEIDIDKKYKYKVGDTVICVETVKGLPSMHNKDNEKFNPMLLDLITKGEKYIVKEINLNKVNVVNVETGKETVNWHPSVFISETEYNAKKFNI